MGSAGLVFVAIDEQGRLMGIPGLLPETPDGIRRYADALRRRKHREAEHKRRTEERLISMSGLISTGTPALFRKNLKYFSGNFSTQRCSSIVSSRKAVICSKGFLAATSVKSDSRRGFNATPRTRKRPNDLYCRRISALISPVSGASEMFLSKSKNRIPKSPLYSQLHHAMLFSSNTETMSS